MTALGEAVIDLGAVAANIRAVAAVARTPLMAVVKADAFGHGAVAVARAAVAAGAAWLGTTSATEALALRAAGLTAPVLSWLHPPDEDFGALIAAGVTIGVSSLTHLHAVAAAGLRLGAPAAVHLKADTGLARNGATGDDWPELVTWARKHEGEGGLRVRGVWSHLATADLPGDQGVPRQVAAFHQAVRIARAAGLTPRLTHLANSAAALSAPATRFDLCRIGLAVYGVDPIVSGPTVQPASAVQPGPAVQPDPAVVLRPALTLRSRVVNVKRVPGGTGVSYGRDHRTTGPTTLALLPLGFADGLPRAAQGRAQVWLGGRRCPIAGRIAMDQCVIDAGDLDVAIGDPVVVFGAGQATGRGVGGAPTVADWARWAGTNPHEVLTGIGSRVRRTYIRSDLSRTDLSRTDVSHPDLSHPDVSHPDVSHPDVHGVDA